MGCAEKKREAVFPSSLPQRGDWEDILREMAETLSPEKKPRRYPKHLLAWSRFFLGHHFSFSPSKMHRWLERRLDRMFQSRGMKINLLAPRGSAKSTLGTLAYPLREGLEGRERYIWIISDTKSQAQTHLENIAHEITENRIIRDRYPEVVNGARIRSTSITLGNGVVYESYGTGQRIRGRRLHQFRPTLIVCDDIQNDDHIVSETRRSRSRTWFHGTLLKAGTTRTNVIHLATALHQEAIAMELLKNPGWTSKVFQAICQWPKEMTLWNEWERILQNAEDENAQEAAREFYRRHRETMDQGAAVLWPENETLYDLMKMRLEGGARTFSREKQNSPINPDYCEFDETCFEGEIWFDELPKKLAVRSLALDPSKGKDSAAGDFSAFVFAGIASDGTIYVDAQIARRPVYEIIDAAVDLHRLWRPDVFGVEVNQFQELLRDEMARKFSEAGLYGVTPYPIQNNVNKRVRIRRLGPLLSARKLRFNRYSPSVALLVDQLKSFPVGDHDDGPDALEMAVRLARELQREEVKTDTLGEAFPIDRI